GNGISDMFAGGVNFNRDFGDNTKVMSNYFYNRVDNDLESKTTRENFSNDNSFVTEEEEEKNTENNDHQVNLEVEHTIDTSSDLTYDGNFIFNDGVTTKETKSENFNNEDVLQSRSTNEKKYTGEKFSFKNNLRYRKRLGKPGRTLTASFDFNKSNDDNENLIKTKRSFLMDDSLGIWVEDSLRQSQPRLKENTTLSGDVRYTEPIGNKKFLQFNYEHKKLMSNNDKKFFDIDPRSDEKTLNDSLSMEYENTYDYDKGGLRFQKNWDNTIFTVGGNVQRTSLNGQVINRDSTIEKDFFNVLPEARLNVFFTNTKRLTVKYNTRVNQPSVQQLQPFVDNSDPLNIYQGNPDLDASYSHNFTINYFSFSQFSFTSFFAMLRGSYTKDKIKNNVTNDPINGRVRKPVNVDNEKNVMLYSSFSTPFLKISKINLRGNGTYNNGILFVNDVKNESDRYTGTMDVSFENRKKKKLDGTIGAEYTYSNSQYSENKSMDQEYLNRNYYAELDLDLFDKWNIGAEYNYYIYSGGSFDTDQRYSMLKASISRFLFKGNKGKIELSVYDLLKQNNGIQRSSNLNYVEETRSNVL
ncbi:MAG: outer membrane beta-barrel protein, partial [Flavobacteriales bacterium]